MGRYNGPEARCRPRRVGGWRPIPAGREDKRLVMKPPDRIRIRLLGGFEIACDDGIASPIRLSTKKVCALVAFLAMNRKQAATREELATLLWGSCSDQQARQSLRQALVLLRKDLRSPNVLYADKEIIRLQPGSWSVDALEFEALADFVGEQWPTAGGRPVRRRIPERIQCRGGGLRRVVAVAAGSLPDRRRPRPCRLLGTIGCDRQRPAGDRRRAAPAGIGPAARGLAAVGPEALRTLLRPA